MNSEDIEVLKNPFVYDILKCKSVVQKYYPRLSTATDYDVSPYVRVTNKEDTADLCIHYSTRVQNIFGKYELSLDRKIFPYYCIPFIENYFEYPLLPTKEEKEMFFIEHGVKYPIPEYKEEMIE